MRALVTDPNGVDGGSVVAVFGGDPRFSVRLTATVGDAALTAGAFSPPVATEGAAFSNTPVFHFTDADPAGTASDYTATVVLGDGNTRTLTLRLSPSAEASPWPCSKLPAPGARPV